MRTIQITGSLLLLTPLAFAACTDVPVAPETDIQLQFASGGLGVDHVASGSGNRVFNNGSQLVFSFGAQEYDDRTSTGQFHMKTVAPGAGGISFFLQAEVTCLSVPMVPSNEAWIAGVIKTSSVPAIIGRGAWFRVKDQGERHSDLGNDQISLVQQTVTTQEAIDECLANTGVNKFGITRGNIQVAPGG